MWQSETETDLTNNKNNESCMKKITILLMSITWLLLASCESKDEAAKEAKNLSHVSHVDVLHEGHRYVVFHSKIGYGEAMCVLHSPDCVCNDKND